MEINQGGDKLILSLRGVVPLHLFSEAVEHFNGLVGALTSEVGEDAVEWEVRRLQAGSALIEVAARSDDVVLIERTVDAYAEVAQALQRNEPVPYSQDVARHAYGLTGILNGKVTGLSFSDGLREFVIDEPIESEPATDRRDQVAWGTIVGEVGSLQTRPTLRLTLFERFFDRAVSCYLSDNQKSIARAAWGHQAAVTGLIYRDPTSGKPSRVRDIRSIDILETAGVDFRKARDTVPYLSGSPLPEVVIRRIRDES